VNGVQLIFGFKYLMLVIMKGNDTNNLNLY